MVSLRIHPEEWEMKPHLCTNSLRGMVLQGRQPILTKYCNLMHWYINTAAEYKHKIILISQPAGCVSPAEGQCCPAPHSIQSEGLRVACLGLKVPVGQGYWLGREVPARQ